MSTSIASAQAEAEIAPSPIAAASALEEQQIAALDFAARPPWSQVAGPDPFLVHRLSGGLFVGGLRGRDRVVLLDAQGRTLADAPAPAGLTGWAWSGSRAVMVGEGEGRVWSLTVDASTPSLSPSLTSTATELADVHALRDVAIDDDTVVLADRHAGIVRSLPIASLGATPPVQTQAIGPCLGAMGVRVVGDLVVANCLLEHRLRLWFDGHETVVEHDGPIWAFDVQATDDGWSIVATGIEDHPLDRSDGSFGYIDSFAFVIDVDRAERAARRRHAINLSEHGLVTPKWVQWQGDARFRVTAAGSAGVASVEVSSSTPNIEVIDAPAGNMAFAGEPRGWTGIAANPLLDAWVVFSAGQTRLVPAVPDDGSPSPSPMVRLGEALAFTTLMAPRNRSTGKLSRFTCEACHFEGTVDGRVHFTGRDDVHATTKTLRGLFGNRPHFSRALDPTTAVMIGNEFRVANRGSDLLPTFALRTAEHPWVASFMGETTLGPSQLREAMMRFFIAFTPEANPAARGRRRWSTLEERGAAVFEQHCEACHQARRRTDDPESRVALADWQDALFSTGGSGIVWARDDRFQTGVEPYVHADGARVPSLRRLWVKRPYFTNGRAKTLGEVLDRVDLPQKRPQQESAAGVNGANAELLRHDAAGGEAPQHPLSGDDKAALQAFLQLL